MSRLSRSLALAACLGLFACGGSQGDTSTTTTTSPENDTPPAEARPVELPDAEVVIEGYIEATGGRAAYEAQTSRHTVATISVPKMNLSGSLELWEKAPDKTVAHMELSGVGTTEIGSVGDLAWEKTSMTGVRILEGQELVERKRDADFYGELHWREHYPTVKTLAQEEVDGTAAWLVELTPETGEPVRQWYAVDSRLLLKSQQTADTQMGKIPVTSFFSDYKKVGEVLMPHRATEEAMGAEQLIVVESVEVNVEIPDEVFAAPPEVSKLKKPGS